MSAAVQEFMKPGKFEADTKTLTETYGRFTAGPFGRGFGVTVGNSLRRCMLSYLEGAAVTSVKFDGVFHEFSTLPGVMEDVADIILNIKELRFKLESDTPKTVFLQSEGQGELKGKDIKVDASVTVLNPEHKLATLDSDGKINLEMTISRGRGYVPSEKNIDETLDTQVIPVDSIFTPIVKVLFDVVKTRVGSSTEFEKLILEVWTDGSVRPEDAIAQAAKVLKDQLQMFVNFDEEVEVKTAVVDEARQSLFENLKKSVEELELSVRSYNCLKNANIKHIANLVEKTDNEMLKTQNFGRKSLNEIKAVLQEMDIHLGMPIDEYRNELITLGILENKAESE